MLGRPDMMTKRVVAIAGLSLATLLLPFSSAVAEETTSHVEITAIKTQVYNGSKVLMKRGQGDLTSKDADIFKRAILADTQVDEAETLVLEALINGKPFVINPPKYGSAVNFTRKASPEAIAVLLEISSFSYDDPVLQLWMKATVGSISDVVRLYQAGGTDQQKVLQMLSDRANSVQRTDNAFTGRAIRNELSLWSSRCDLLALESRLECRQMIYDGIVFADKNGRDVTTGNIPDVAYEHLAPKE